MRYTIRAVTFTSLAMLAVTALAEPPPWAPAKGWRKKNEAQYVGYSQREWRRDYGVTSGRCNTDEVLTVVGAVAGGVIGNRIADRDDRAIATLVGALIGGIVGDKIGDRIDARDRACVGHSLELARTGQTVRWVNPDSRLIYVVTPRRERDGRCREFDLLVSADGRGRPARAVGCADGGGAWTLRTAV
jgi:surface antigen